MSNLNITFQRMEFIHNFLSDFIYYLSEALPKWADPLIRKSFYVLRDISTKISNVSSMIHCFDINKILGLPTEEVLEKVAYTLMQNNHFYAGIVFIDMVDDNRYNNFTPNINFSNNDNFKLNSSNANIHVFPPFVRYKIRMDSERVDATNIMINLIDQIGARRNPMTDLKYYYHGFVLLQDLLDTAIIDVMTGNEYRTVEVTDIPFHTVNFNKKMKKQKIIHEKQVMRDNYIRKPGILLQQSPYPCYWIDMFLRSVIRLLPLILCISWNYSAAMLIKNLVYEKEIRLKEYFRIMGVKFGIYRLSWMLTSLFLMELSSILMVLLLIHGKIFTYSNMLVVFLVLTLFNISVICFSFFVSSFFSKSIMAATVGGIAYFLIYLPFSYFFRFESLLSLTEKLLYCLLSNVAMAASILQIARWELAHEGVQWDNLNKDSHESHSQFNIGYCMLMLVIDSVIFYTLGMYIETVKPGTYGVPKPWYYPVLPFFNLFYKVTGRRYLQKDDDDELGKNLKDKMIIDGLKDPHFESETVNLIKGIEMRNLVKAYDKKLALDNLNGSFYEDQISVLLGHNGAGKSTAIAIMVGVIPPSSGDILLYGQNIKEENNVTKQIGLCPQYNVIIEDFTVEEHLFFYAKLKNLDKCINEKEVYSILEAIDMQEYRFRLAKNLSGGMKRRLCIAIAFVGNSKIIILDEPTAGVDPFSRHGIWDILIKFKKGRTILLTTHYMDEANILGDKISILSRGKLRCSGSALFLKSIFAKGYYLTIIKDSEKWKADQLEKMELMVKEKIFQEIFLALLRNFVANSEMIEHIGNEYTFILPYCMRANIFDSPLNYKALKNLFIILENYKEALGINSYGLTDASLEEVFIKVTALHDKNLEKNVGDLLYLATDKGKFALPILKGTSAIQTRKTSLELTIPVQELKKGERFNNDKPHREGDRIDFTGSGTIKTHDFGRYFQQYIAICQKRYRRHWRNFRGFLLEVVLPVSIVFLTLIFMRLIPSAPRTLPLPLTPWTFKVSQYIFFKESTNGNSHPTLTQNNFIFDSTISSLQHDNATQYIRLNTSAQPICIFLVDPKSPKTLTYVNSPVLSGSNKSLFEVSKYMPYEAGSHMIYNLWLADMEKRLCTPGIFYEAGPKYYSNVVLKLHSDYYNRRKKRFERIKRRKFSARIESNKSGKHQYLFGKSYTSLHLNQGINIVDTVLANLVIGVGNNKKLDLKDTLDVEFLTNTKKARNVPNKNEEKSIENINSERVMKEKRGKISGSYSKDANKEKIKKISSVFQERFETSQMGWINNDKSLVLNDNKVRDIKLDKFSLMRNKRQVENEECHCPHRENPTNYHCAQGAAGKLPPIILTKGPYSLLNYTGIKNISSYMVKTTFGFNLFRVGGFEHVTYKDPLSSNDNNTNATIDDAGTDENVINPNHTGVRPLLLSFLVNILKAIFNNLPNGLKTRHSEKYRLLAPFLEGQPRDYVKIWYDNRVMPSMPSFLSLFNNAYLKFRISEKINQSKKSRAPISPMMNGNYNIDDYGILVVNHPIKSHYHLVQDMSLTLAVYLTVAIAILSSLSFVPASCATYLVLEKVTHSKHLQMVSSVHPWSYWLANFTCDFISYVITMTLVVLLFVAFDEKFLIHFGSFQSFLLLLMLYGWAIIPYMYPLTWIFQNPGTGLVVMSSLNLLIGAVCTLITSVLEVIEIDGIEKINNILKNVFLIFPQYGLCRGLLNIALNNIIKDMADRFGGSPPLISQFEWNHIGRNLVSFVILGFASFGLTVLLEYGVFDKYLWIPIKSKRERKFLNSLQSATPVPINFDAKDKMSRLIGNKENIKIFPKGATTNEETEEEKVAQERIKVDKCDSLETPLIVRNVTKVYDNNVLAVHKVAFVAEKGECLGLLGVNGAGKTTTFKMVTAETSITEGNIFVHGKSIREEREAARQFMGYCSQDDSLDQLMTTVEILQFYSLIKGISREDVQSVVDWSITNLDLLGYEQKLIKNLSEGTKRKLSTAVALVGNPPIILLDEPTTGMDPSARRFLWNCILELLANNKCILFTSHSMEECEVLCSKIAIMVNGKIQCIGSLQHLKSRYGEGYFVTVKLKVDALSPYYVTSHADLFINYLQSIFPVCSIKEKHESLILIILSIVIYVTLWQAHFPQKDLKLSLIFDALEEVREKYGIQDYSITQSTLEQVFCLFAAKQKDTIHSKITDVHDRVYSIPYHLMDSTKL
ncbi:unnamed protein product [Gordionus sp. m RMFG-2023]